MKYLLLTCLLFLTTYCALCQPNVDSIAFTRQRNKINAMLAERRSKFGQYDTSLTQRSGIFGMQTKGDIRRSNEILMDIAATDDEIFIELKKLFDYRTNQLNYRRFQQKQSDSTLKELEKSRNAFMQTITRLQNKNESLQAQLINQKADHKKWQGVLIAIIVLMLASILMLLLLRRKRKA